MHLKRREFLKGMGAVTVTSLIWGSARWGFGQDSDLHPHKQSGIILVVDETIPYLSVYDQFDLLRKYNTNSSALVGDDLCFGLYAAGDGSKEFAKSCAKTCDGWIVGMQCHGFGKVAVMVWSRRLGPMLTIPLKTRADIMLVRAYGPSTISRPPLSCSASVDPIVSHLADLEGRMTRNGRPFVLKVEQELNYRPLEINELPDLTFSRHWFFRCHQ